jgi:hypothetical protein
LLKNISIYSLLAASYGDDVDTVFENAGLLCPLTLFGQVVKRSPNDLGALAV